MASETSPQHESIKDSRLRRAKYFFPLYGVSSDFVYKPSSLSAEELLEQMHNPRGMEPDQVSVFSSWGEKALKNASSCGPDECIVRSVRAAVGFEVIHPDGKIQDVTLSAVNGLQQDVAEPRFVNKGTWTRMTQGGAWFDTVAAQHLEANIDNLPVYPHAVGCRTINKGISETLRVDSSFCPRRLVDHQGKPFSLERWQCPSLCGERTALLRDRYAIIAAQFTGMETLFVGTKVTGVSHINARNSYGQESWQIELPWNTGKPGRENSSIIFGNELINILNLGDMTEKLQPLHQYLAQAGLKSCDILVFFNTNSGTVRIVVSQKRESYPQTLDKSGEGWLYYQDERDFWAKEIDPLISSIDFKIFPNSFSNGGLSVRATKAASDNVPCLNCMTSLPREGINHIYVKSPNFPPEYYNDISADYLLQREVRLISSKN